MMNAFLRNSSRFPHRDLKAKRRRSSARRYRGEQLESRAMLAGDIANVFHNADMPADVSGDGLVSISDALLLISELRHSGPRDLSTSAVAQGEGEGGGMYVDVNGDQMLTLGDPLGVIAELRSEGEGVAVTDNLQVMENTTDNQLNVLDNDQQEVGDMLTVNEIQLSVNGQLVSSGVEGTVITSESGGQFRIAPGRQTIIYTPRPGFFGTERVTYVLNDGNANLSSANVNLTVRPVNPAVQYRLVASQTPGGPAITNVDIGDNFILSVYVQDIRSDLNDVSIQGLEQGFLDLAYNTGLVTLLDTTTSALTFGSNFTNFRSATFSPGEIGEAGASRNFAAFPPPPPLMNAEVLLFSARFTAAASGSAVFNGNHPENNFSQTLVTNPIGGENVYTPGLTPVADNFVLTFVNTSVTINPPGFAMSDSRTIAEDSGPNNITVLANDTTPAGGTLSIVSVTTPANGTAVINNNGTPGTTADDIIIYTPNANFSGQDTFTYVAADGLGNTDSATVTVNVTDVNDPPTAGADTYTVAFNSPQRTLNVLANDSTAPDIGETLTITAVSTPNQGGTATVNAAHNGILYTPPAGNFATDTFTYTISDGRGGTAMATVTINGASFEDVVSIRLEPSATQIGEGDTFTLNVFIQDLRNDPSIDLGVFSAYIDLMYDASIVVPIAGSDGSVIDFTGDYEALAPPPIFVSGEIQNVGGFHPGLLGSMGLPNGGDEFFFFSVDFMALGSGTAIFTTSETSNQQFFPIELADSTGATDPVNPDDVSFGTAQVIVAPPIFDTDVVVSVQAVDTITGLPVTVLDVGDKFEIRVSVRDTRTTTPTPGLFPGVGSAYIDLLIAALGDAVMVVPGSFEVGQYYDLFDLQGTAIDGVGINDIGSSISFSVISDPSFDGNQPNLVFSLDFMATGLGEVVFQPAPSGNPDNTITYFDPTQNVPLSEITFLPATVFIADANAPTAVSDRYTAFQGSTLTVPAATGVLANDTDPNGNSLTAAVQSGPSNGTLTFNSNGSFTYTPNATFVGTDNFTYRATDSTGLQSNTAIVRIDVVPIASLQANDDVYTTPLNTALMVNVANGVLTNDVGMGLTAALVSNVAHGTLTFNANGSFNYTPNTGFTGIDVFTYRATDASGAQQIARVAIGVGITPGSMSGRVYIDSNRNGIYEPLMGELAIGNAKVTITGSSIATGAFYSRTVTTNAAGQYSIGTLLPANYTIVEPFPKFLLSGTVTVNGTVTTNTAANLTSFTAIDTLTAGESTVVNFGHMGIDPFFLTFRDVSARTPRTGMMIAKDAAGNHLWYTMMDGWTGFSNPTVQIAANGQTAALTIQSSSGSQTITIPVSGPSLFRTMGTRPGEGSIIRIEGTVADAIAASAGEGEFDENALDALMAEGFE